MTGQDKLTPPISRWENEGSESLLSWLLQRQENGGLKPVLQNVFSVHRVLREQYSRVELRKSPQIQVFWALVLCTCFSLRTMDRDFSSRDIFIIAKKQLFHSRFFLANSAAWLGKKKYRHGTTPRAKNAAYPLVGSWGERTPTGILSVRPSVQRKSPTTFYYSSQYIMVLNLSIYLMDIIYFYTEKLLSSKTLCTKNRLPFESVALNYFNTEQQ